MKTLSRQIAKTILIVLVTVLIAACDSESNPASVNSNNGTGKNKTQDSCNCIDSIPLSEVNETEISSLKFMIEEEKMARDIYLKFYSIYSQQIFSNIASSEESHFQALAGLLNRYSLENPTIGKQNGEFVNSDIINLYSTLLSMNTSYIEALKIGALIEETDIKDIDAAISKTDNLDIQTVYTNLRNGSKNHLRSFVKNINNNGLSYSPQILSQEEYDLIINN